MKGVIRGAGSNKVYLLDDREVSKEEFDVVFPDVVEPAPGPCSLSAVPPNVSDALAVHPLRCEEAEADARAKGVPTEFEREFGRPVFTSREHQKRYLKAYGYRNHDGGYGD